MKPILIILITVFVCLVLFSTMSIQVVFMIQRNLSRTAATITTTTITKTFPFPSCVATRKFIQQLVKDLKREKVTCVIDWGSLIGEVSLPLVKAGFVPTPN